MSKTPSDALRVIIGEMEKTKTLISHAGFSLRATTSSSTIMINAPILKLQSPGDIFVNIDSLCLAETIRQKVKDLVIKAIEDLQRVVVRKYDQICRDLPPTQQTPEILQKIHSLHQQIYEERQIALIRRTISDLHLRLQRSNSRYQSEFKKAPFNFEYVPFLEAYFEQNAYPSNQDRQALARKSKMSPRQIEVWFQNHRNRAKKEGQVLKRLTTHSSLNIPSLLDSRFDISRPSQSDTSDSDNEDNEDNADINVDQTATTVLSSDARPSHAFPTRFSAAGLSDPFPTTNFPSPQWRRHPATKPVNSSVIDMNSFAQMFSSKLVLRAGPPKNSKYLIGDKANGEPWFSATTTTPCPAPHPALIRASSTISPSMSSLWWSSKLSQWKSAPAVCQPVGLPSRLPSWTIPTSNTQRTRKAVNLPKRVPSSNPLRLTNTVASNSVYSRVSSISSVSSLDSISASTSDESSPEPTTPLLLPQDVAQDALYNIFTEESNIFDDLFNGDQHQYSTFNYSPSQSLLSMAPIEKNYIPYDSMLSLPTSAIST